VEGVRRFALAALVVLAGCGDSSHPTVSARVVSTAAAKTTRASTARISERITGTLNGESLGDGALSGVVDSRHGRASIVLDLSALARATSASFGKGRLVFAGNDAFVTGPAIVAKLRAGRRWVRVTRRQASGSGGSGLGSLDATRPVDHLRAAVGKTEVLGRETIDGVSTKHYRTHVDYRLYLPLVPRDRRATLENAVALLQRTLSTTRFPVEVWIAPDGTIRRTTGVIDGRGAHLEYTLDLTAIGKPVRIVEPPATLVLDGRKPP
jgi:hypothetical protein